MNRLSVITLWLAFSCVLFSGTGRMMALSGMVSQAGYEATRESDPTAEEINISQEDILQGKAAFIGQHEVRIAGKLYDIRQRSTSGNVITLQVKWDEREEGLLSELSEHIENLLGYSSHQHRSGKTVIKVTEDDYLLCHYKWTLIDQGCSFRLHNTLTSSYSNIIIRIYSPPPQA